MGRSAFDTATYYPPEQVNAIIDAFMTSHKFRPVHYRGDTVMKRGYGFWTAPMFLKVIASPGTVHIEAWIRSMGEHGLDGFIGVIPKQMLQGMVNELISSLNMPPMQPPAPPMQ